MFVPRFEMLIFFAAKATPGDNVKTIFIVTDSGAK